MPSRQVTIVNKLGLHARAAARFVQEASGYDCGIDVTCNGKTVSGKSIMGIMMLAASRGSSLEIAASGPEAEQALDGLESLIADRFGEAE